MSLFERLTNFIIICAMITFWIYFWKFTLFLAFLGTLFGLFISYRFWQFDKAEEKQKILAS
jgi:hypothetical protein